LLSQNATSSWDARKKFRIEIKRNRKECKVFRKEKYRAEKWLRWLVTCAKACHAEPA
jgi:hypothetical protein